MLKKIFNADDFGISPGVNTAICKAHKEGILNSASLMINQKYAGEAVAEAKEMPALEIGLHLNLTNEVPVANPTQIPLLINSDGKLKNGFVNLLILSLIKSKELSRQVEIEMRAQIEKYKATGLPLKHIDGHRHVHLIPVIFTVLLKLAKEYDIPRIRTMNENILYTVKYNKDNLKKNWFSHLMDGSIIKYILLRVLTWWNKYPSDTYFYTMLWTCKISKDLFHNVKVPAKFKAVEVMMHPGMPEIDKQNLDDVWDNNILSAYRTVELETLLDKNVPNGIDN
ncbi:MAG: ChbG/HpnK family deacetylase [Alphaproteobacteria bacterium]|nr:ChbG/HpnK family deacetylase [Alphaproteobacteria bacterium]